MGKDTSPASASGCNNEVAFESADVTEEAEEELLATPPLALVAAFEGESGAADFGE